MGEDVRSAATTTSPSLTPLSEEGTLIGSGASKATEMAKQDVETQAISPGASFDDMFLSQETTPGVVIMDDTCSEVCVGTGYGSADQDSDRAADKIGDEESDAMGNADENRNRLVIGAVVEDTGELVDEDVEMPGDTRPAIGSREMGRAGVDSSDRIDEAFDHITEDEALHNVDAFIVALPLVQGNGGADPDSEVNEGDNALSEAETWDAPLLGNVDSMDDTSSEMDLRMTESPFEHAATPLSLGSPLLESTSSLLSDRVPQSSGSSASSLSGLESLRSWPDDESLDRADGRSVSQKVIGEMTGLALHLPAGQSQRDGGQAVAEWPLADVQRSAHVQRRSSGATERNNSTAVQIRHTSPRSPAGGRRQYTSELAQSNQRTLAVASIDPRNDAVDQTLPSRATSHPTSSVRASQRQQIGAHDASDVQQSEGSGWGHVNFARIRQCVANALEQAPTLDVSRSRTVRWQWLSSAKFATFPS